MPPRYGTPAIRPQPLETRLQDVLAGVDSPAKDAARAVVTIMQSSAGPQAHCNQTLQDVLGELRRLFGGALELPDISQGEEVATGEIELPHGTVWRKTATGWEHIQPKYRVLRKIAEWQQQIEDMASQPGSPLMALVTVQKRIPHFCPFALLHITIFICGDMALSPTDRNKHTTAQSLTVVELRELANQLKRNLKSAEWWQVNHSEIVKRITSDDTQVPSNWEDFTRVANSFLNTLEQMEKDPTPARRVNSGKARADQAPKYNNMFGDTGWLKNAYHAAAYALALCQVLMHKATQGRMVRERWFPDVSRSVNLAGFQERMQAIVDDVCAWASELYDQRGAREDWWMLELVHWLGEQRPRPQVAASCCWLIGACRKLEEGGSAGDREHVGRWVLATPLRALLFYLGTPDQAEGQTGSASVPWQLYQSWPRDLHPSTLAQGAGAARGRPRDGRVVQENSSLSYAASEEKLRGILRAWLGDNGPNLDSWTSAAGSEALQAGFPQALSDRARLGTTAGDLDTIAGALNSIDADSVFE